MTDDQSVFRFPGRWLGGISLILAPVLLLAAELLLAPYDFFYLQQLKLYAEQPALILTSYRLFLAGNILLWPGIIVVANLIGKSRPIIATWGGMLVILGLFARTFHYGVNHLAFQLVDIFDLTRAIDIISKSYGAFHIVSTLSGAIMFGWIVLAIGTYQSGTLGIARSVALAMMSALMIGVLKGSSVIAVITTICLCIALVPLGWNILTAKPKPGGWSVAFWTLIILLVVIASYYFGQAG